MCNHDLILQEEGRRWELKSQLNLHAKPNQNTVCIEVTKYQNFHF